MNVEELREYCLSKPYSSESFPFNETTLVFKVAGKIFVLVSLDTHPPVLALKCDPEYALELRDRYSQVTSAYHMNKRHWITVLMDGSVPDRLIREWIEISYGLIVARLPKSKKTELDRL